ncbi:flagellin [Parazoarcus communis]|uniref:Flagellin n=1 Tax=Parazoarcus communis SWub3 = DSM 12120 TaxID=1121029 RepID=A0A323UVP5_9RHOO|nr:flagellin [Parazoarcus communis]NMG70605.1 flagellin [Parazoarcus communis SWub3 = DSM 12120]PZA15740.1 flagellin [Azoarcus communis] [Parazoarcus communis SWub3 = DSM 12120]
MAQVINTNVASLNAQRNLNQSGNSLATSLQRLSSGLRINSAKDDAAGLAISERFTAQIRGLNQAVRNANDGVSLAQTAEGALGSAGEILQRVRELAVQSANASNSSGDRQALQNEVTQLVQELDRIATTTNFNGKNMFDGTFGTAQFQVGANANQTISTSTANLRTTQYGNNQVIDGGTQAGSAAWGSNGVTAGTLAINGYLGSANVGITAEATAKDMATAINAKTGETGVTATARTELRVSFGASGNYSLKLQSDNGSEGQAFSFTLSSATGADSLSAAVTAINGQSGKTGVTAELAEDGNSILLTNATGNDIGIRNDSVTNAGDVSVTKLSRDAEGTLSSVGAAQTVASNAADNAGALVSGYISLDSDRSFSYAPTTTNAFTGGASTLNKVSALDITTFNNSTQALKTVDAALNLINNQRSAFGALQSRFEATVSNLQTTSENLAASRSRILDADFASETANLTRAQILQQAGTAMLAQANSLPQNVLSLLR